MKTENDNKIIKELYNDYLNFKKHTKNNTNVDYYDELFYIELSKYFPERNAVICDLGCGAGRMLTSLKSEGYNALYGCDVLYDYNNRNAIIEKNDIISYLNKLNRKIDAFILNDVLEHLSLSEIIETLLLCFKRLSENGMLILKVPNGSSPFSGLYQNGDLTHITVLNESSIHQIASLCKFKVVKIACEKLAIRRYKGIKKIIVECNHFIFKSLMSVISMLAYRKKVVLTSNVIAILKRN